MKTIKLLFLALLLTSCAQNDAVIEEQTPKVLVTFQLSGGANILPGDNYYNINVSGLPSPYTPGELRRIRIDLTHPDLSELSIILISPAPYNAQFSINDVGFPETLSGANLVNCRMVNGNTNNMWTGTAPYTGAWADNDYVFSSTFDNTFGEPGNEVGVNGTWVVQIYNWGTTTGFLGQFRLIFNV